MIVSNYAIKFRTAVFVFIVVLVIMGATSYVRLPREGAPDITIPYVFVTAFYEGTAPSEMETLVTVPLEKNLSDLENVKEIRSTSAENISSISIEFQAGANIDMARQRAKNKVDLTKPDLPEDLDEPIVDAFNFSSDFPVLTFALSGDTTLARLKNLSEMLQDEIELLPGVKEAAIRGVQEREIRVELDLTRLAAYRIPLSTLLQRIPQENATISAGNIEVAGNKFQVRVPGEFKLASEIRRIIVATRPSGPVYMEDVATVRDTYKDVESISRLNGEPCVSVDVKKRSGENAVALVNRIKTILKDTVLPPDITLTIVMDQSDYVDLMLKDLENNILSGFLLVIAVLFIFMGGRNSLFVALAIPFSMLIAFVIMSMLGATLNMIVLFSLVLAVGMLVDNAIVIVENIYRLRSLGATKREAARQGTAEVAWPVITSTLTTLAAFSPLLFWPDIMGQFMGFLPWTLIMVLSSSLFVAIVINPAVCSALISTGTQRTGRLVRLGHRVVAVYERLLRGALNRRLPVMLVALLVLFVTMQLYGLFGTGVELFPETEPRNATIQLRFPQGTSVERTDAALRAIEKRLPQFDDIKFFLTTVGRGGPSMGAWGGIGGTHGGQIHVEFLEHGKRKGNTMELVSAIREVVGVVPGAEVRVAKEEEGPPTGDPISIELSGTEFDRLSDYSKQIIRTVETVPGLVDLQDDWEEALPEVQFRVDRDRAALLGVDTAQIGTFLRMAIYGLESDKLRLDEEEYDITLRFAEPQRNTIDILNRIFIPTHGGESVPLSSLGEVVYTGGRGSINRKDQKRMITISGNNQGRGVDEILAEVQPKLRDMGMAQGYAIDYGGDTREMRKAAEFLGRAFAVALGLIVVILVVQFNSALLPVIILSSVVLSLAGVLWGLLLCNLKFGVIMTGLGVISLAGIVVNNAIVLIDCIRQRREEGLVTLEAIVAAGRMRLRPVMLTAATTILGLIPMAVGWSLEIHEWPPRLIAGAETTAWWQPMAVAVIFGLSVATVLTLVLVPVMYSAVESLARVFRSRFAPTED